MLFTTIRDFFVEHVFGGRLSSGRVVDVGVVGTFKITGGSPTDATGKAIYLPINVFKDTATIEGVNVCDWLSTTATIVSMIAILIIICLFIKWIFKVVSGAIILR